MDSLTQIVLGASVGEAVAGKKLGNKALLFGAIAGTIPDLDVLANPFLDMVTELSFHRSVTHSFLFAIIVSPIPGLLLSRIYRKNEAVWKDWSLLFFFGFVTHYLLDTCTTWGTQLFWPFSDYGYAWYNIFVVDPLYTVPFLGFVVATAFFYRRSSARRWLNYLGLGLSTAYLLFSVWAQQNAETVFEKNLVKKEISAQNTITKATPLNTLLWSFIAKADDGYWTGYYSLLDKDKMVTFDYHPRNAELLDPYLHHEKVRRLLEITKGYYTVERAEKGILVNDLRFGELDGWRENGGTFVFVYQIWIDEKGMVQFKDRRIRPEVNRRYFIDYWHRILGR